MASVTTFYDNTDFDETGVTSTDPVQWTNGTETSTLEVGPLTSGHDYIALISFKAIGLVGLHQGTSFAGSTLISTHRSQAADRGVTGQFQKFTASDANQVYTSVRSWDGSASRAGRGQLLIIDLTELGTSNYAYSETTSSGLTASTSYTDATSITLPSAGNWLIMGVLDCSTAGGAYDVDLYDGTNSRNESKSGAWSYGVPNAQFVYYYHSGASSGTQYSIRHKEAAANYTAVAARLFAIKVSASANYAVNQQTTDFTGGSSYTTITNAVNTTYTPLTTRSHIVLWMGTQVSINDGSDAYVRLRNLGAGTNLHNNIPDVSCHNWRQSEINVNNYMCMWAGPLTGGVAVNIGVQALRVTGPNRGDLFFIDTEFPASAPSKSLGLLLRGCG